MKIALTGPFRGPIGNKPGGGTTTFLGYLAAELVKRGHDIDVYTLQNSEVAGRKIGIFEKGSLDLKIPLEELDAWEVAGSIKTFQQITANPAAYDIIHNNQTNLYSYLIASQLPNSVLTLHPPASDHHLRYLRQATTDYQKAKWIAVSQAHARQAGPELGLTFFDTIYNGLSLDDYTFVAQPTGNYLTWLARLSRAKGLIQAMQLASACQTDFQFGGAFVEPIHQQEIIETAQQQGFTFHGHLDRPAANQLLGQAKAFLYPVQWDEPFGYVLIEAMACGTPIISYDRGAISEIVVDGVTGFICPANDEEAMKDAIRKLYQMPADQYQAMRQASRQRVEELFTVEKMVDRYEVVYNRVMEQSQ